GYAVIPAAVASSICISDATDVSTSHTSPLAASSVASSGIETSERAGTGEELAGGAGMRSVLRAIQMPPPTATTSAAALASGTRARHRLRRGGPAPPAPERRPQRRQPHRHRD